MPHLAPINWILTLSIFWLALLTMISIFWWSQTPSINLTYNPSPARFSQWSWSN